MMWDSMSTQPDTYLHYHIPANTGIIPLVWTMHRSPIYFPSPSRFAPERFLPRSHPLFSPSLIGKPFPGKWTSAGFGFGRRACAGADLATAELFIVLAKMIWAFTVEKKEGETYDIDEMEGGMVLKPRAFGCQLRVRSEERRRVVERELGDARRVLEGFPVFE